MIFHTHTCRRPSADEASITSFDGFRIALLYESPHIKYVGANYLVDRTGFNACSTVVTLRSFYHTKTFWVYSYT